MAENNELLPRKELIQLWQEIAQAFSTELQITVDNNTSLAMRFAFKSKFGQTEISINDSAGSAGIGGSSLQTSVVTKCDVPLKNSLSINLPPLFSKLLERFRKDVSTIHLYGTKYWIKSESAALRATIDPKKLDSLDFFSALYLKAEDNTIDLRTTDFLGKSHQIQAFAKLHLSIIELISKT